MADIIDTTDTILDVPRAAARRRSIRTFAQDPLPIEDIHAILDIVRRAPSAWNLQPWRFVVVESPDVRAQLVAAANNQRQVQSAPATIVLYTDMVDTLARVDELVHPNVQGAAREKSIAGIRRAFAAKSDAERDAWGYAQGFIALGFLLLAAESHGYQTSPMAGFDAEQVKALLGLPAHARIPALVAIGRGVEDGNEHHRLPTETLLRLA